MCARDDAKARRFEVALACKDEHDARKLHGILVELWKKHAPSAPAFLATVLRERLPKANEAQLADAVDLYSDVLRSLRFDVHESVLAARLELPVDEGIFDKLGAFLPLGGAR